MQLLFVFFKAEHRKAQAEQARASKPLKKQHTMPEISLSRDKTNGSRTAVQTPTKTKSTKKSSQPGMSTSAPFFQFLLCIGEKSSFQGKSKPTRLGSPCISISRETVQSKDTVHCGKVKY